MTIAFGLTHLLVGVGAAHVATKVSLNRAMLEWVGGLALVIGLASFGVGLASVCVDLPRY